MSWRTWSIEVEGFDAFTLSAPTRSKARAEAYSRFSEPYPDVSFIQFARKCRVLSCGVPSDDGYDYVRRAYGVEVKVGQRIVLVEDGKPRGLAGEVVYPGQSTAHIHVVIDGRTRVTRVHPSNFAPEGPQ